MKGALLAIGLGAAATALPSTGSAQELPACPSDKTMDARVTSQERGEEGPIVATHEVTLEADVADRVSPLSTSPDHVAITPEAGVQVVKGGGSNIRILAPATSTLTVVVTWRQSTDPSNFDETGRCSGSQTITLPVLSATPARGAKQPNPGPANGDYTFAIAAATKRPDLRPLEISVRSTGHARYPRASERLRRWTLPMRTAEQVNYHKRLPNLAYATTAQTCRFWWLTCGPTFAHLAQLNVEQPGDRPRPQRKQLDPARAGVHPTGPLGGPVRHRDHRDTRSQAAQRLGLRHPGAPGRPAAGAGQKGRSLQAGAPLRRDLRPLQAEPEQHGPALTGRSPGKESSCAR